MATSTLYAYWINCVVEKEINSIKRWRNSEFFNLEFLFYMAREIVNGINVCTINEFEKDWTIRKFQIVQLKGTLKRVVNTL